MLPGNFSPYMNGQAPTPYQPRREAPRQTGIPEGFQPGLGIPPYTREKIENSGLPNNPREVYERYNQHSELVFPILMDSLPEMAQSPEQEQIIREYRQKYPDAEKRYRQMLLDPEAADPRLSYDPFGWEADLHERNIKKLLGESEGISNYENVENDMISGNTPPKRSKEVVDAELLHALDKHSNVPYHLTDETLQNPYAAKNAEALRIRTANTPERQELVDSSLRGLYKEYNEARLKGDYAAAANCIPVINALENKQPGSAYVNTALNDQLWNIPSNMSANWVVDSDPTMQQLAYMGSYKAALGSDPVGAWNAPKVMDMYNAFSAGKSLGHALIKESPEMLAKALAQILGEKGVSKLIDNSTPEY